MSSPRFLYPQHSFLGRRLWWQCSQRSFIPCRCIACIVPFLLRSLPTMMSNESSTNFVAPYSHQSSRYCTVECSLIFIVCTVAWLLINVGRRAVFVPDSAPRTLQEWTNESMSSSSNFASFPYEPTLRRLTSEMLRHSVRIERCVQCAKQAVEFPPTDTNVRIHALENLNSKHYVITIESV
jgi:hypothetical protein